MKHKDIGTPKVKKPIPLLVSSVKPVGRRSVSPLWATVALTTAVRKRMRLLSALCAEHGLERLVCQAPMDIHWGGGQSHPQAVDVIWIVSGDEHRFQEVDQFRRALSETSPFSVGDLNWRTAPPVLWNGGFVRDWQVELGDSFPNAVHPALVAAGVISPDAAFVPSDEVWRQEMRELSFGEYDNREAAAWQQSADSKTHGTSD